MLVKELLEKLDCDGINYFEITSNSEFIDGFGQSIFDDKNYREIKKYLDKEVKKIGFRTNDVYDENFDGEMYLLDTEKILEIEILDESQYGKF